MRNLYKIFSPFCGTHQKDLLHHVPWFWEVRAGLHLSWHLTLNCNLVPSLGMGTDVTALKGTSRTQACGKSSKCFSTHQVPNFLQVWESELALVSLFSSTSFFCNCRGWLNSANWNITKWCKNSTTQKTCKNISVHLPRAVNWTKLSRASYMVNAWCVFSDLLWVLSMSCLNIGLLWDFLLFLYSEPNSLYWRQKHCDEYFPWLLKKKNSRGDLLWWVSWPAHTASQVK